MKPKHITGNRLRQLILGTLQGDGEWGTTGDALIMRSVSFNPKAGKYGLKLYRFERSIEMTERDVRNLVEAERKSTLKTKISDFSITKRKCGCVEGNSSSLNTHKILFAECWFHYKKGVKS